MASPELHYRWTWELAAPPAALWPLVSDTDRFNRDCGLPPVEIVPPAPGETTRLTNSRRLRLRIAGVPVEWDERAFSWLAPRRFGVERVYRRGPIARMRVQCELEPRPDGGTTLTYDVSVDAGSLFGQISASLVVGQFSQAAFGRIFRRYDEFAQRGLTLAARHAKPRLARGGAARLTAGSALLARICAAPLVHRLTDYIRSAEAASAARIRPYALADNWGADRRRTLELCLHATRAGLLDLSWDVICPHCRGARRREHDLSHIERRAHCESCQVDFEANFDRFIELTFVPNPAIRVASRPDYCVGGPQLTPHILAQEWVPAGATSHLPVSLTPGRYRARSRGSSYQPTFRVETGAPAVLDLALDGHDLADEPAVAPEGELRLFNADPVARLVAVEHLAWTNDAATASEVTALQTFRDLFSREVLRADEQISVSSITLVFTDLKDSTQLYSTIGDAPAFGRVLTHFEVLRAMVREEGGAVVKTMGDAVMAVFPRPLPALRATLAAQQRLARPDAFPLPEGVPVPRFALQPLALKAAIHTGPCLVLTQNDRLDYFGTTVNIGARLCSICQGAEIVISEAVETDAEVARFLREHAAVARTEVPLRSFGDRPFSIARVQLRNAESTP
ncbi:SRPBCC family protein [Horticoccus luteus]|uniref:SRPBCC family protein n=1 Tax=Horticoccus luteus TaxID=2862869 RepID=A0A8F9TTK9_9BACT|nr:DUF5939 domain-containing protein [Horticoccus luteus]QYM77885.1 SRPBCC family protein [Horticoccus luteus]